MSETKCAYCGTEQPEAQKCKRCGAPLPEKQSTRFESPFYYNGFMIWPERDSARNMLTFHVWQGDRRVHFVELTHRMIYELIPDGCEFMPFVFDFVKLALGEKECLEIEQKNNVPPVRFEIKRIEEWKKA